MPGWEDAIDSRLIVVVPGDRGLRGCSIELTAEGRMLHNWLLSARNHVLRGHQPEVEPTPR
jgi:hypothetical protein